MSQTDIEIQLSEITAESDADEETRPKSPIVYRLPKNELYYPPKELTWFYGLLWSWLGTYFSTILWIAALLLGLGAIILVGIVGDYGEAVAGTALYVGVLVAGAVIVEDNMIQNDKLLSLLKAHRFTVWHGKNIAIRLAFRNRGMFPLKKPAPVVRAQNVVWQYLLVYKNRYDLLALKSHIKYVQIMDFGQELHRIDCNNIVPGTEPSYSPCFAISREFPVEGTVITAPLPGRGLDKSSFSWVPPETYTEEARDQTRWPEDMHPLAKILIGLPAFTEKMVEQAAKRYEDSVGTENASGSETEEEIEEEEEDCISAEVSPRYRAHAKAPWLRHGRTLVGATGEARVRVRRTKANMTGSDDTVEALRPSGVLCPACKSKANGSNGLNAIDEGLEDKIRVRKRRGSAPPKISADSTLLVRRKGPEAT